MKWKKYKTFHILYITNCGVKIDKVVFWIAKNYIFLAFLM